MYFRHIFSIAISCAIICFSPAFASAITNPSFEDDLTNIYLESGDATGWVDNLDLATYFTGDILNTNWRSAGTYGAELGSTTSDLYFGGELAYMRQSVNLSGATGILFDAKLFVNDPTDFAPDWNSFITASFLVDSQPKWTKQALGTYLNQSIDVTGLTGSHTIEFQLYANSPGANSLSTSWFGFDNVSVVPEPCSILTLMIGAVLYSLMLRKQLKSK
jgi:hypothetical protein